MNDELALQFSQMGIKEQPNDELLSHGLTIETDPEFSGSNDGQAGACNLIINYLPHDIDDAALRVSFSGSNSRMMISCMDSNF